MISKALTGICAIILTAILLIIKKGGKDESDKTIEKANNLSIDTKLAMLRRYINKK